MLTSFQPAPSPLRVASGFSGIGGIERGLQPLGRFAVTTQIEIREHARRVLARHFPGVPQHTDIRAVQAADLGDIDLLVGGPPCQDISDAGKCAGICGSRSGLWFEFLRLIEQARPRWVIIEQVEALRRRGLSVVLAGLHQAGYAAEWHCIPATSVGALHLRDRIFIVAWRTDLVHGALLSGLGDQLAAVRAARVWATSPEAPRTARDVPYRAERLTGLGNSIVPQLITALGAAFLAALDAPAPLPSLGQPLARWQRGEWIDQAGHIHPDRWPRDGMLLDGAVHALAECIPSTFGTDRLLWPTPTVGDGTGGRTTSKGKAYPTSLRAAVRGLNPKYLPLLGPTFTPPPRGASLNPTWVDWLMGYPAGWTALDEDEGDPTPLTLPAPAAREQLLLPLF